MTVAAATRVVEPADPGLVLLLDGVVLDGDALTLAAVPARPEPLGPPLGLQAVAGPAGIAIGPDGAAYVADPAGHRVLRVPACGGASEPVGCLGGPGAEPGRLREPRGVVAAGDLLYVADTGNGRVQALHLPSGAPRSVVAGEDVLREPWDLAIDAAGRLHVADRGLRALVRLLPGGEPDAPFAAAVAAQPVVPRDPVAVAASVLDGEERILVLDLGPDGRHRLLAYGPDGALDEGRAAAWTAGLAGLPSAPAGAGGGGVAVAGGLVCAAGPGGRVLAFSPSGELRGPLMGPAAAGLAVDGRGRLVLRPIGSGALMRLGGPGAVAGGTFRLGPVPLPGADRPGPRRLGADALVPAGAGLRLYALTTDREDLVPPPLPADAGEAAPEMWSGVPEGAEDALVRVPGRHLWIGGRLAAAPDGASARVASLRVGPADGWLGHLPAVYAREDATGVLARLLALMEGALAEQERLIDDLPLLLDAARAPDGGAGGAWLAWLAGWLGTELGDRPRGDARRELVARAFSLHGIRGTAEGLRELARLLLGIEVEVVEPPAAPVWTLAHPAARLGAGTGLAAAEPDGAVLGTTAVLGGSHLLDPADHGAPLAAGTAHRVTVRARAADLDRAGGRAALEEIVAREAPAHVAAHVCAVEPRMRVGLQASVGIDAIVARPGEPLELGPDGPRLGHGAALGAAQDRSGGAVGARLGAGLLVT